VISYVLLTRDRPCALAFTLAALGRVAPRGAEVVVVDNASAPAAVAPPRLVGGAPVRLIPCATNRGAAARNIAAEAARGEWLVMLDDDSHPLPGPAGGLAAVLAGAPADLAAIGADIVRPGGRREAGGLPEVFVGCGAAVRRSAFRAVGGYDESFGYYVEEYDLCARLLAAGWRVGHDRRFRVVHRADPTHRATDLILRRLVRNGGWVLQRYAPAARRTRLLLDHAARYAAIAAREGAAAGFAAGLRELLETADAQPRRPLDEALFDRFTGLSTVRSVARAAGVATRRVAVVDAGKNAWAVREGLEDAGAELVDDERDADLLAIGTLSPGPLWDAWERRARAGSRVLPPWIPLTGRTPGAATTRPAALQSTP
jgi:GT2 family glycosyltransferase